MDWMIRGVSGKEVFNRRRQASALNGVHLSKGEAIHFLSFS